MVLSVCQYAAPSLHLWPSPEMGSYLHGATMETGSWALAPMATRILHKEYTLQLWSLSK